MDFTTWVKNSIRMLLYIDDLLSCESTNVIILTQVLVHKKPRTWVHIIIAFDMEVKLSKPTLISSDPNNCKITTKLSEG